MCIPIHYLSQWCRLGGVVGAIATLTFSIYTLCQEINHI